MDLSLENRRKELETFASRFLKSNTIIHLSPATNDLDMARHVGFTSSIHSSDRPALTRKLKKEIKPPGFTGRAPGGPSRWSTKRSAEWEPLSPELVVEVQFDHFSGGRFRHGTKLLRWRPDKDPRRCTTKQVER